MDTFGTHLPPKKSIRIFSLHVTLLVYNTEYEATEKKLSSNTPLSCLSLLGPEIMSLLKK